MSKKKGVNVKDKAKDKPKDLRRNSSVAEEKLASVMQSSSTGTSGGIEAGSSNESKMATKKSPKGKDKVKDKAEDEHCNCALTEDQLPSITQSSSTGSSGEIETEEVQLTDSSNESKMATKTATNVKAEAKDERKHLHRNCSVTGDQLASILQRTNNSITDGIETKRVQLADSSKEGKMASNEALNVKDKGKDLYRNSSETEDQLASILQSTNSGITRGIETKRAQLSDSLTDSRNFPRLCR